MGSIKYTSELIVLQVVRLNLRIFDNRLERQGLYPIRTLPLQWKPVAAFELSAVGWSQLGAEMIRDRAADGGGALHDGDAGGFQGRDFLSS